MVGGEVFYPGRSQSISRTKTAGCQSLHVWRVSLGSNVLMGAVSWLLYTGTGSIDVRRLCIHNAIMQSAQQNTSSSIVSTKNLSGLSQIYLHSLDEYKKQRKGFEDRMLENQPSKSNNNDKQQLQVQHQQDQQHKQNMAASQRRKNFTSVFFFLHTRMILTSHKTQRHWSSMANEGINMQSSKVIWLS